MDKGGCLIVISGFSGVGKGTVSRKLVEKYGYLVSVSATTRAPRQGEVNGREYFFVSKEDFLDSVSKNGFIEHATYVNNYYGTPRAFVESGLKEGRRIILEIEVQGALAVKEQYPDAALIFITAPSAGELKERLTGRGTESRDVIDARMERAVAESEYIEQYDYIVCNENGKAEECADAIHHIVESRGMQVRQQKEFITRLKDELAGFRE